MTPEEEESSRIFAAGRMLIEEPFYRVRKVEGESIWHVLDLLYYQRSYDGFCVECSKDSTFQASTPERPPSLVRNRAAERIQMKQGVAVTLPDIPNGVYTLTGTCARSKGHTQTYVFLIETAWGDMEQFEFYTTVQKIGQHPSFANLNLPKVKPFAKVLSPALMKELSSAIGLASHDVGVGSYVYLRRVFESLIEDARSEARAASEAWDDAGYQNARMPEKIKLVRDFLPPFLVDNAGMYGLLSIGIHELSEDECLDSFPALLAGTELLLEERLQEKMKTKRIAEATAALQKATAKHKK